MKINARLASPAPYLAWLIVSTAFLFATNYIGPYLFAMTAYGAAGVSIVLISLSFMLDLRLARWALLSAAPTIIAFVLLSTVTE